MWTPAREPEAAGVPPNNTAPLLMFDSHGRSVKRPRPVKSCTECRKRKLKCDRLCPCSQCQKSHRYCKYATWEEDNPNSDGSEADAGERHPKRLASRPAVTLNGNDVQQITSALIDEFSVRLERLEQLVVAKDSPSIDWASVRSQNPQRVATSSATIRGISVKGSLSLRTRFFGQNSTRVLLNLVSTSP